MRVAAFQRWLEQRYPSSVAATRIANVRRVEHALGNLDAYYKHDNLETIMVRLTYGRADEMAGIENRSGIDIDGNVRNGLAKLKSAVKLYLAFCDGHTAATGAPL